MILLKFSKIKITFYLYFRKDLNRINAFSQIVTKVLMKKAI